jgi:hypothetical protein
MTPFQNKTLEGFFVAGEIPSHAKAREAMRMINRIEMKRKGYMPPVWRTGGSLLHA